MRHFIRQQKRSKTFCNWLSWHMTSCSNVDAQHLLSIDKLHWPTSCYGLFLTKSIAMSDFAVPLDGTSSENKYKLHENHIKIVTSMEVSKKTSKKRKTIGIVLAYLWSPQLQRPSTGRNALGASCSRTPRESLNFRATGWEQFLLCTALTSPPPEPHDRLKSSSTQECDRVNACDGTLVTAHYVALWCSRNWSSCYYN